MSQYITNKIETLVPAGTSFGTAILTDEVKLDNFQSVKVVITSGEGDEATTTARILAVVGEETKVIREVEITVGGNNENTIDFVADEIAKYDATGFKVSVDAIAESTLKGGIVAVFGEARYSE